jgi:tricarballylate dehydrogenase
LRGGNTRHARNFRLMHDRPAWYVPDVYGEDAFFKDLLRVTHGATDERLARMLIRGSATIAAWLDDNGVRLQDPASGAMPYSRRTAFFLGGGKAMINALYATALRLGVRIGYDSEVVALSFDDDRGCEADIAHDGSIGRVAANTMVLCSGGHQANLDWLRESFGAAADGFMIRGTPYVTGSGFAPAARRRRKTGRRSLALPHGCGRRAGTEVRRRHRHPHHRDSPWHRRRPRRRTIS